MAWVEPSVITGLKKPVLSKEYIAFFAGKILLLPSPVRNMPFLLAIFLQIVKLILY